MAVTLWHLKLFTAVAESGSMSAAAARYMIRQPSVSQKIGELETHYGVLLFERFGNRLQITESGKRLLPLARDLTSRFDFLDEFMSAERGRRRLRVGGTITVGSAVFPRLLQTYREENPDVELFASVSNTSAVCEKLLNNELDAALVEGRVTHPDLISTPKINDSLVLACGRAHPFYSSPAVRIGQLDQMEFVMREPGSGTRELFEQYVNRHGVKIRTLLEYNNPDAMRKALFANSCLAVISVLLLEEDAMRGDVRLFQNSRREWNRTLNLVRHKNKHIGRPLSRFFELLDRDAKSFETHESIPMGLLLDE
ncbi:LysR family transcriptional regulator [Bacilliculturomica massiliensis]|uniref:LysR family transcriptional regulator n=1 Tax=Bacilliculturomica massiliensis TaxID=1917867 RepID=UPI0013EF4536|nr:LysR family transcriptional regulator [Bacilliculturomica massiliensis]